MESPKAMIEIKKEGDRAYHFCLKSDEGNTLLKSIDFPNREELNGVLAQLHSLIEDHVVVERQTNHSGKFLFQLKDLKGKIIGKSQLYGSEAGMENGIKNLRNRIAALNNAPKS